MDKLNFVLLALCISLQVSGQKEFTPGYVIKISGDTMHGYLQEEIRSEIHSKVKFKTSESDLIIQTFTPSELKLFKYESGNLYRTISFINTLEDTSKSQTLFARQLVEGVYNLYSYVLQEQTYFVVLGNGESYFIYNSIYANLGDRLRDGNYIYI